MDSTLRRMRMRRRQGDSGTPSSLTHASHSRMSYGRPGIPLPLAVPASVEEAKEHQ